jgi:hypothetical protein
MLPLMLGGSGETCTAKDDDDDDDKNEGHVL